MKIAILLFFIFIITHTANSQLWVAPDTIFYTLNADSIGAMADSSLIQKRAKKITISQIPDSILNLSNHVGYVFIFPNSEKKIEYTPQINSLSNLKAYSDSINTLGDAGKLNIVKNPLAQIRHNYMVAHPEVVEYTWREVPEPWRDIRDGRRIRKDKKAEMRNVVNMINTGKNGDKPDRLKELPKEEVSPWTTSGQENMQMSQLYLGNWAKGGESSLSLVSDFRYSAKYAKGKHQWENSIVHKMGVTHTSTLGTRVSDDALDLSSKYGYQAVSKWYYSFQNTFKTQMFRNYSSSDKTKSQPKSTLLSPAYIQFIFGMDYKKENLSLLLSPYTAVMTLVVDTATIDQTAYSIPENRRSNTVDGFSITLNWKKNITNDITYTTKGELFYEYFEKDGQKRFDWENVVDLQINRFLSTRFIFELRYYDNESDKFQVKENISISFKYSFK